MRKFLRDNAEVFVRLENVERKQSMSQHDSDKKFDGQVFDAYTFIADLTRVAKQSIVLIDNYVDETVLSLCIILERL